MSKGLDLDTQMSGLIAHSEISEYLHLNPKTLRPCIAKMLKTSFYKGGIPDRSSASAIIAAEFVGLGFDRSRIEHELLKWNKVNDPPIKYNSLNSTINTALRNHYRYSCKHEYLREFCIGFDLCLYSKGKSNNSSFNFRTFFSYHWQLILSTKAKLIYWLALPELEKRKGLKPGSIIYECHHEIAKYAGISRKYVKGGLEELVKFNLIEYKVGTPRKWEGKASEIRRIFPIAKPPKQEILRVTNDPL
jgi:hypothetical protein